MTGWAIKETKDITFLKIKMHQLSQGGRKNLCPQKFIRVKLILVSFNNKNWTKQQF